MSSTATEAPGAGDILRFTVPLMMGLFTYGLHAVVDAMFVGRLGTPQLAGLGFAGSFYVTIMVLFFGIMRNSVAFASRAFGAGKHSELGVVVANYQWLALAATPVIYAMSLAFPWFVAWGELNPEVARHASVYVAIRVWEAPFILLIFLDAAYHQSKVNARLPMLVHWGVLLVNIVLDYGLIYGRLGLPALGVAGSALATVLAHVAGAVFIIAYSHRAASGRADRLHFLGWPRWRLQWEIIRVSVPLGVGDFIEAGGFMVFFLVVGRLGETALAANNIGVQIIHLLALPGFAAGIAASTYMGRYLGAQAPDLARTAVLRTLALGAAYMGGSGLLLVLFGRQIASLFSTDPVVIGLAMQVFIVMAAFEALDAVGIILRSALAGAGDTRLPTAMLCGSIVLVLLPSAWWFSTLLRPPLIGVWLGAFCHITLIAAMMTWRFRVGAWRRITLGGIDGPRQPLAT
jgi:MATE family multidrug resistance protein